MNRAGPYAATALELAGTAFGSIEYVAQTGSTNADAAALLGDAALRGHTIVAEYQQRGAGRKGRSWEAAPQTALLFTTILPHAVPAERLWLVPYWAALGVRSGLDACGVTATLQWPNDLLLGEAKIAGILCQSRVTGSAARVACGVGINVHRPSAAAAAWAFCDDVTPVDRSALLRAILLAYDSTIGRLEQTPRVVRDWEAAAGLPGRRYRIARDGAAAPFEALAQGLQAGGDLRVVRDDGTVETVALADARVLR